MKAVLLALICSAGCIVGESGPAGGGGGTGDGDGAGDGTGGGTGQGGGMGTGNNTAPDGGVAAACTNAVYDPCTTAAECTSGKCQPFEQAGIQVCTQSCTPGDPTTCPQQNGQPVPCNNMGICRPPAANTCAR